MFHKLHHRAIEPVNVKGWFIVRIHGDMANLAHVDKQHYVCDWLAVVLNPFPRFGKSPNMFES